MRVLPSRTILWMCLLLCITQVAFIDAGKSRKDKKKIEEETAPDPVSDEENSDPASSGRDARQHSNQSGESGGPAVNPEEDIDDGDGAERTKKSYCATGRSHDGNYNEGGHPHGTYGRPDGHYQPDMDQYHRGDHGPGYGTSHSHGYMPHGPDAPDYHHLGSGHYDGPEGYGGDGGKGHANTGYARKSQGDYGGYGGLGNKGGGDQYHAAASAASSVYRPSYQAGHESYGGSDYSPSYGYGSHGPSSYNAAPYGGGHAYPSQHDNYAPHPHGQHAPGYSAGHMKSAYGGGFYPPPASYGPAYGAAPMYGPMYHGPSGYSPAAGYPSHGAYNPYMPYNAPAPSYQYGASYPISAYPPPYGYGPSPAYPPPPPYLMHGPHHGIPVTLTCSLQQHDTPYGYPAHPRGNHPYYRASDGEPHTGKPPLTVLVVPSNHTKTQKPNDKSPGKEQKDEPIPEADKDNKGSRPAVGNQAKTEGMKGDLHAATQATAEGGGGMEPHGPRESAPYLRMPFSMIRQRQMEPTLGRKQVFYQTK